jgi:hypothetical protein
MILLFEVLLIAIIVILVIFKSIFEGDCDRNNLVGLRDGCLYGCFVGLIIGCIDGVREGNLFGWNDG